MTKRTASKLQKSETEEEVERDENKQSFPSSSPQPQRAAKRKKHEITTSPVTPSTVKTEKNVELETEYHRETQTEASKTKFKAVARKLDLSQVKVTAGLIGRSKKRTNPNKPSYRTTSVGHFNEVITKHKFPEGSFEHLESGFQTKQRKVDAVHVDVEWNVSVISVPVNRPGFIFITIADHTGYLTLGLKGSILPADDDKNFIWDTSPPAELTKPPIFAASIRGKVSFQPSSRAERKLFIVLSDYAKNATTPNNPAPSAFTSFFTIKLVAEDTSIRHFAFPFVFGKITQIQTEDMDKTICLEDPTGSVIVVLRECSTEINVPGEGSYVLLTGAFDFEVIEIEGLETVAASCLSNEVTIVIKTQEVFEEHWDYLRKTPKSHFMKPSL